jgi:hypothetical protein
MVTNSLNETKGYVKNVVLTLLIMCAAVNTTTIISGYQKNALIHESNHQTLIQSRINIEQGSNIQEIHLQKLRNDKYTGAMPYMPNYDYINYWIRDYYMLKQDIKLIWK